MIFSDRRQYIDQMHNDLIIEPTKDTPYIRVDQIEGLIEIKGRSSPQSALEFFHPLIDSIKKLKARSSVKLVFNLEYFNTSSAKCIFNVFRELNMLSKLGITVEVDWLYEEDDEDMREIGTDFEELTKLPFHFIIDYSVA